MKPKESAPLIDHMATIGTLLLSGVRANVLVFALLSETTMQTFIEIPTHTVGNQVLFRGIFLSVLTSHRIGRLSGPNVRFAERAKSLKLGSLPVAQHYQSIHLTWRQEAWP